MNGRRDLASLRQQLSMIEENDDFDDNHQDYRKIININECEANEPGCYEFLGPGRFQGVAVLETGPSQTQVVIEAENSFWDPCATRQRFNTTECGNGILPKSDINGNSYYVQNRTQDKMAGSDVIGRGAPQSSLCVSHQSKNGVVEQIPSREVFLPHNINANEVSREEGDNEPEMSTILTGGVDYKELEKTRVKPADAQNSGSETIHEQFQVLIKSIEGCLPTGCETRRYTGVLADDLAGVTSLLTLAPGRLECQPEAMGGIITAFKEKFSLHNSKRTPYRQRSRRNLEVDKISEASKDDSEEGGDTGRQLAKCTDEKCICTDIVNEENDGMVNQKDDRPVSSHNHEKNDNVKYLDWNTLSNVNNNELRSREVIQNLIPQNNEVCEDVENSCLHSPIISISETTKDLTKYEFSGEGERHKESLGSDDGGRIDVRREVNNAVSMETNLLTNSLVQIREVNILSPSDESATSGDVTLRSQFPCADLDLPNVRIIDHDDDDGEKASAPCKDTPSEGSEKIPDTVGELKYLADASPGPLSSNGSLVSNHKTSSIASSLPPSAFPTLYLSVPPSNGKGCVRPFMQRQVSQPNMGIASSHTRPTLKTTSRDNNRTKTTDSSGSSNNSSSTSTTTTTTTSSITVGQADNGFREQKYNTKDLNSDLAKLKATATRLRLSTRRPSYLAWLEEYSQDKGSRLPPLGPHPGAVTVTTSAPTPMSSGLAEPKDQDPRPTPTQLVPEAGGRHSCRAREKLTTERKLRIDTSLEWLRTELQLMRTQDQALARQLLSLYHEIHKVRLSRSCQEHRDLLDDVLWDLEELYEFSNVLDLPRTCLLDTPLKHVGVTRLNICARRFSAC